MSVTAWEGALISWAIQRASSGGIMNRTSSRVFAVAAVVIGFVAGVPAVAATSCEGLAKVELPNTKITSAQIVAAGAFVQPGGVGRGGNAANPFASLPAFCRVTATLTPSNDSDIKTEVWLPASGWNGKFL